MTKEEARILIDIFRDGVHYQFKETDPEEDLVLLNKNHSNAWIQMFRALDAESQMSIMHWDQKILDRIPSEYFKPAAGLVSL